MTKTALVTGCAGFIGSHLTDRLLELGYQVIGIDNFRTGNKMNISSAMENERFDLLEEDIVVPSFVDSIKKEIDIVFHLAAIASVAFSTKDPMAVTQTNVEGTVNVLEVARRQSAKRFVFASSAAVYGDPRSLPVKENAPLSPLSPYAASKIAGEYYVKSYKESFGLEYAILRLFNVYGPRQDESEYSGVIAIFADRAVNGKPLLVEGDGLQTRSFIHVTDVVEAMIQAAHRPNAINQTINISGKQSISIIDLAKQIGSIAGAELQHQEARVGDIRDSIGDTTRAREILGVDSSVPLEEGLRSTLEWYRSRDR